MRKHWDSVVRTTHWLIAVGFVANRFINEPGGAVHECFGWLILVLVIVRLLWGISFAPLPARLRQFLPSWRRLQHHWVEIKARQFPSELGHNALGALAVWAFWLGLILLVLTGWAQDTELGDNWPISTLHSGLANALTILVIVHIIGIVVMSYWSKRNLIAAMLPDVFGQDNDRAKK
ncbi:MAG: cytochrome b/b6 domain-containing protein [Plesiomonas sp.]|uniref:cytochrome b/b6 domain-containing protein n=1 Tax=Plesiomonas sp. TaxID=2486279 RepID=UPI003F350A7F